MFRLPRLREKSPPPPAGQQPLDYRDAADDEAEGRMTWRAWLRPRFTAAEFGVFLLKMVGAVLLELIGVIVVAGLFYVIWVVVGC